MESNTTQTPKSRLPWIILSVLVLLVAGFFSVLVFQAMQQDAMNPALSRKETPASETLAPSSEDTVASEDSGNASAFLEKLHRHEDVALLFVGDAYAAGQTYGEHTLWEDHLLRALHETFDVNVRSDCIALSSGNNAYSSYVALMQHAADAPSSYDAVFVSLGFYDDPFVFEPYLRGCIRSIREQYPEATIYGLIPSSALTGPDGYADENATLQTMVFHDTACSVINLAEAFAVSHRDITTLTDDGLLPNERGADVISSWILSCIRSDTALDAEAKPDENANRFLHYRYISAADLLRSDDTHYQCTPEMSASVFPDGIALAGLDVDTIPGASSVELYCGDRLFKHLDLPSSAHSPERHILPFGNNLLLQDTITLSFSTKEQADQLRGFILSGNASLIGRPALSPDELNTHPETTEAESLEETTAERETERETETTMDTAKTTARSDGSVHATPRETASLPHEVHVPETAASSPATSETIIPESASIPIPETHTEATTAYDKKSIRPGQGIDPEAWAQNAPSIPVS